MSIIDELIYDRTQADVDRVFTLKHKILIEGLSSLSDEEKSEYMSGMKGAYNASDLNRVSEAVKYLYNQLTGFGYTVESPVTENWTGSDIPLRAQMNQYLLNVQNLINAYCVRPDTPDLPENMDSLNWQKANAIEQNLKDIADNITNMQKAWVYCGEVYCGEGYFA